MDTFSPKGSIQWDFDFGGETKNSMITTNALVVKSVDTKDLKAEGFTSESVYSSPR